MWLPGWQPPRPAAFRPRAPVRPRTAALRPARPRPGARSPSPRASPAASGWTARRSAAAAWVSRPRLPLPASGGRPCPWPPAPAPGSPCGTGRTRAPTGRPRRERTRARLPRRRYRRPRRRSRAAACGSCRSAGLRRPRRVPGSCARSSGSGLSHLTYSRRVLVGHGEIAVGQTDADDGAVADIAGHQGTSDPGLDLAADEAAQRAGAVDGVEALLRDVPAGLLADLEGHLPVGEPGPQIVEHQVDDALDLREGQGLEQHDLVQAVQELGPEW